MFPKQQLYMVAAFYVSLLVGLLFHQTSAALSPYIKYFMISILYLAFIKISPSKVWDSLKGNPLSLTLMAVLKLLVFPLSVWLATRMVDPPMALPMLMLASTSTAVAAPLFVTMIGGDISYSLVLSVVTSLALPITMPALVGLVSGVRLEMNANELALFLAMIIFIPLMASYISHRLAPKATAWVVDHTHPISLVAICMVCFASLGRFYGYLSANTEDLWTSILAGFLLAALGGMVGFLLTLGKPKPVRMAATGSMVWINQVITLALGVEMDRPLLALVSAVYLIPLFLSIPLLARLGVAKKSAGADPGDMKINAKA